MEWRSRSAHRIRHLATQSHAFAQREYKLQHSEPVASNLIEAESHVDEELTLKKVISDVKQPALAPAAQPQCFAMTAKGHMTIGLRIRRIRYCPA
jgi:hypothetical protein